MYDTKKYKTKEKTMKALAIKTNGSIEHVNLSDSDTISELQEYVDGWVQVVGLNDNIEMWLNEEGKIEGLPHNTKAQKIWDHFIGPATDYIVGNVIITGAPDDDGNVTGLTTSNQNDLMKLIS